jgi:small conductance mechanosensitive channel
MFGERLMQTNAVQIVAEPAEPVISMADKIQSMGMEFGLRIVAAIAILILGKWVVSIIKKITIKAMKRHQVDQTLRGFIGALIHISLQVFVIIAALGALNVKTASLVAVLGAAGLAVGLALQGSLANFAAGVLLIIFKPFTVDDVVDAGGAMGTVREIGILNTHIDTLDNKMTIVPNAKIMSDNIVNYTANDTRRVDIVAGISYGDDIDKAREVIQSVLNEVPGILNAPAPDILVAEMADSSVNFNVRPWCTPADYWNVYFGVTEGIKKAFDREGISIPFPQRDVHIYEHKSE